MSPFLRFVRPSTDFLCEGNRAAPIKRTAMEKTVNIQMLYLFGILMALSVGCAIGSLVRNHLNGTQMWYLLLGDDSSARLFVEDILTFIILFNNLLPISYVIFHGSLEMGLSH